MIGPFRTRISLLRWSVFGLFCLGCIPPVHSLGPVPRPPDDDGLLRLGVTGGGGMDEAMVQGSVGGAFAIADWFSLAADVHAGGTWDPDDPRLAAQQELSMPCSVWPVASGIFHFGPVDWRISLFGIGGGGPEGPGGYMGLVGSTVGYRFDGGSVYAGFTAQAVYGLSTTEYQATTYEVPLGLVFHEVRAGEDGDLAFSFTAELVWQLRRLYHGPALETEYQKFFLLAGFWFDIRDLD